MLFLMLLLIPSEIAKRKPEVRATVIFGFMQLVKDVTIFR